MTFLPLYGASCLLGQGANIAEAFCLLLPLLASKLPPYDKALNWIEFTYTGDWLGDYVDPESTNFNFNTLLQGKPLFAPALRRLQTLYSRAYARGYMSTLGPLGIDY